MTTLPTAEALFANPDHYLFAFEAGEALFLPVDRDVYRQSLFLDDRIALDTGEILPIPVQALAAEHDHSGRPIPRIGWIFHVAHCGSTLLARALDWEDRTLVLREPLPLRQLGVEGAGLPPASRPAPWQVRLRLAAALVGRRYRADAPAIVKANVPVNMILLDLMALDPAAPGILLYHPLEAYLLAILRSDAHRKWVMNVTEEIAPAITHWAGPIAGLPVVERAAALWLAQIRIYQAALAQYPMLRSLPAGHLFGAPHAVLAAAFALFELAATPTSIDDIVTGPLFATHAKRPGETFDEAMRQEREAHLADLLSDDLDRARRWIHARSEAFPVPLRLAQPLIDADIMLLGESPVP